MKNTFLKEGLGWGFVLWLIGYLLGILFFMFVPIAMIGWYITPIGIAITLWVLFKKISSDKLEYFLKLGFIWMVMAIVLDYVFLVMMFKPEDGYYKLDVYFYYFFTLVLPPLVGWIKAINKDSSE
jgi:hypothetical protein